MKKTKIPKYIVREKDRLKFQSDLSRTIYACNRAFKRLKAMPDLEDIPDSLQDIDAATIEDFINERLAEISQTKMLTSEKKKEVKEDWENVRKDALSYISTIKDTLAAYPDAEICVKGGEVVCSNFTAIIEERCKIATPEPVKEHYELILAVKDAIQRLRDFEKEHDYPTGDWGCLERDIKDVENPESLIENWIWQNERRCIIEKNADMLAAYETMDRRMKAEHQAKIIEKMKKYEQDYPADLAR